MNRPRQSDWPISTEEAVEQKRVGLALAENVEGRGQTKGNLFQQNKSWAQYLKRGGRDGLLGQFAFLPRP